MSSLPEIKSGPKSFEIGHFQDLFAQAQENPTDAIAFARQNLGSMKPEEKRTVEFTLKIAGLEKNPDAKNLLDELKKNEDGQVESAGENMTETTENISPTVVDLDAYRQKREQDINNALDKMAGIIDHWDTENGAEGKFFLLQSEIALPRWEKLAQQSPKVIPEQDITELKSKIARIKELVADYKMRQIEDAREDVNKVRVDEIDQKK